ncbi:merR regulatory family protein, partial [Vibrio parahaemolyticus V-223/04]
ASLILPARSRYDS